MKPDNDILGIKPYGEAVSTVVKKSFDAIEGFLSITCKPVLEELGNMMKDKVRVWRLNNILKVLEKSKGKFDFSNDNIQLTANPKVALAIIENASNEENDDLQEMWAGLFNSSLSETGKSDDAIIYVNILKQLTIAEAKLLMYICENAKKGILDSHLPMAQTVSLYSDKISEITGIKDLIELEVIVNHLNALRLSERRESVSAFSFRRTSDNKLLAWFTPTSLALSLYIRCQGFKGTVAEYWKLRYWSVIQEEQKKQNENPSR